MIRLTPWRATVGLLMGFGLAVASLAQAASSDEIIASRQNNFKHINQIAESMKKAIDASADVTQFAGPAMEIADWGKQIPTVFPDGTQTGHGTHALPPVWTDRATFESRAAALVDAATKLSDIAKTGDKAAFAKQYEMMGGACYACHRQFRARLS